MHMADALVAPTVAVTMYACSAVATSYSIKKVRLEDDTKMVPVMGVMGAFVFATQMINFTIPGTGSSGHLCGGMLLSAILGPWAGFLTMVGILLIQCLLFADGGILALGCNIWNMAFYGCFVGGLIIWKSMMKKGVDRRKIVLASILGCVLTLQMGAFSVTVETLASHVTELPFTLFVSVMQPIHLAIGLVEGLITSAVLLFIYEARPELLWTGTSAAEKVFISGKTVNAESPVNTVNSAISENTIKEGRLSYKKTLGVLFGAVIVIAGGLSLIASAFPDGLEWSIEKITGSTELEAAGGIYALAEKVQGITAILPDYAFKTSDTAAGTTFSGILGSVLVIGLCLLCCRIFKYFGKSQKHE